MRHVTWARILGLLLMVGCAVAANWMLTDDQFTLDAPTISGDLRFADRAAMASVANLELHPNVVQLNTGELRRQLLLQPGIADAQVSVTLPNAVDIAVTEHVPVFGLVHDDATFLVDADGLVLSAVDADKPANLGLPLIRDLRSTRTEQLQPGMTLDPLELAAIVRLGAVTPEMVDSAATSLELSVRDEDGFVITAQPQGWQAIFGYYTPNLRPVEIIPRQVQCLRSLLGPGEANLQRAYLAPLDERCGTYEPVSPIETPRATPTPRPQR